MAKSKAASRKRTVGKQELKKTKGGRGADGPSSRIEGSDFSSEGKCSKVQMQDFHF